MIPCLGKKSSRAEITSQEKRKRVFTVGFHEEVAVVKRDGFPVNPVKMIRKEQDLVAVKMLLKEQNKDAALHVPPVKHTKGGKVRELERYSKKRKSS